MNIPVYFGQYHLLITDDMKDFKGKDVAFILSEPSSITEFEQNPRPLFADFKGDIGIFTPQVEDCLEGIISSLDCIVAAGGIVENEKDEVLVIFRKGFWDLPKGKVEKGEKIIDAAGREIEEETGVKADVVIDSPLKTYHCYQMKGIDCIKETFWYDMSAKSSQKLIPQTAEDITEIKWMNKVDFLEKKHLFYPLIAALLTAHFEKR